MPAPVTGGLSACSTPPRSLQHNDNDNNPPLKMDRPSKRAKTGDSEDIEDPNAAGNGLRSLHRSITPPPCSRQQSQPAAITSPSQKSESCPTPETICSPISLTHIRDLPGSSANNVETVQLRDLLGDPMIRECWQFNYLFDVDYLMEQFDEDVRELVIVKVVHGSWKREASNRIRIDVFPSFDVYICVCVANNAGSMCKIRQCRTDYCVHARAIWYASFQDDDSAST